MSYKTDGWKFTSNTGYEISFKTNENNEFRIFYELEEEDNGVLFHKKDIPDLVNLLLEIQNT